MQVYDNGVMNKQQSHLQVIYFTNRSVSVQGAAWSTIEGYLVFCILLTHKFSQNP